MKKIILGFMFLMTSLIFAQDGYIGYWMMPKGKFIINIEKIKDNEYIGHVVWLKDLYYPKGDKMEGVEQYDRNNPDKSLRVESRKVMGLLVVGELFEKDSKLQGGWIYDSWNGKMYHGSAKLLDENTLKLRGSFDRWGILGLSQKAKRVENPEKYGIISNEK
ncbi:MAG TPA: hypothetical protein DCR90_01115 [Fusobacteriaceae bacterium]|jgi:uncharacterized protein (DUF2147 family)|nr:hypothetical protein [Fusobacteriaceae bacterium]